MYDAGIFQAADEPVKTKSEKPGISKKKLWAALKYDGMWSNNPPYNKAAKILGISVKECKTYFSYYWNTPGAKGPVTIEDIKKRASKRKIGKIYTKIEIF